MIKKMLSFTDPQIEFLETHSSELGIGVPELVRRTVDHYRGAYPQVEAKEMLTREVRTEEGVDVQVLVESESGQLRPTKLYIHDGKGYIEGVDGQRYAIHVRNRFTRDVEIVMSVDGLDITTGKEASAKAEGHIVRSFSSYTFEGFRISMSEVATFRFGGIEGSYASQMGKPRNIGVIGVAVFPEKAKPEVRIRPASMPLYRMRASNSIPTGKGAGGQSMGGLGPQSLGMDGMGGMSLNAIEPAPCPVAEAAAIEERSSDIVADTGAKKVSKGLGTSFGESRQAPVVEVEFNRESETPWKMLTIRYDTLDNLKELSIVTDESLHERENADPFPASRLFCQPPPNSDQSW